MVTVVWVNASHSFSYRVVPSDMSKVLQGRVVGIVCAISCRGMGGSMAGVASTVRSPCVRSLAPRPRLGRGVDCAWGRSSGEALIVLEVGAWARRWLRSRPRLGRGSDCSSSCSERRLWLQSCKTYVHKWLYLFEFICRICQSFGSIFLSQ